MILPRRYSVQSRPSTFYCPEETTKKICRYKLITVDMRWMDWISTTIWIVRAVKFVLLSFVKIWYTMWVYIERERTVVECNAIALRQEVCRSLRKIDASSATTKLGQFILWNNFQQFTNSNESRNWRCHLYVADGALSSTESDFVCENSFRLFLLLALQNRNPSHEDHIYLLFSQSINSKLTKSIISWFVINHVDGIDSVSACVRLNSTCICMHDDQREIYEEQKMLFNNRILVDVW